MENIENIKKTEHKFKKNLRKKIKVLWDIILILLVVIFVGIIAITQYKFWYFVIILDIAFIFMIWRLDKTYYISGKTVERRFSFYLLVIVFIMLALASILTGPWNIAVFFLVVLPIVSLGAFKRRKKYQQIFTEQSKKSNDVLNPNNADNEGKNVDNHNNNVEEQLN